ncbi:MAG: T9SS type A sorting domain-containing protein [Bacteroidales bacterium]|nr:T9SS type A sorting domain-containing protein [Bacteroidales bacterium]
MKKFLLIIISAFIFGSVFASQNSNLNNPFGDQNQSDSTSINFYELQKLKLYPNPASSYLFIEYDIIFVKEAKLQIYNSIGAIVYTKTLKEKQDNIKISVSDYKNGLYFCSLQIDGKLLNTRKILINH